MGCSPLFLCLKNQRPMCGVIATMGASLYAIVWIIWGIVDIRFERKVTKVLYIIGFGLICLSFICFLALFIFLHFKITQNYSSVHKCGRIVSFLSLIFSFIAFVLILTSFIMILKDYVDIKDIKDKDGEKILEKKALGCFNYICGICFYLSYNNASSGELFM